MKINAYLRQAGLELRSVYSWEATNGSAVVFKLWRRDIVAGSSSNLVVRCLGPDRPNGPNGPRWDRRRQAVLNVMSGAWKGFATLGDEELDGDQRTYVGFSEEGVHRIISVQATREGAYFATLSPTLVPISGVGATAAPSNAVCEVLLGNSWRSADVSTLIENGNYRTLTLRCPVCHGPIRLEGKSAPGKKQIMRDRFEHVSGSLHDGCPLIRSRFKGVVATSPFAFKPAPVAYPSLSEGAAQEIASEEAQIVREVPDQTVREQLILARVGQGQFRIEVLDLWGRCCVTNCELRSLLVASHIVPWREATNMERLDAFNGLLLSPTLDRLFDRHLISFKDTGEIILSNRLRGADASALGISPQARLRTIHPQQIPYLVRHRARLLSLDAEQ